jgi:hypothetical protein
MKVFCDLSDITVSLVEHFKFFSEKNSKKCPLFFTLFFTEKASEKLKTFQLAKSRLKQNAPSLGSAQA